MNDSRQTARRHIKIMRLRADGWSGALVDRHTDTLDKRFSLREQDLRAAAYMQVIHEMVDLDLDPVWAEEFRWPLKRGLLGPRTITKAARMLWQAAGKIVPAREYSEDHVTEGIKAYGCYYIKERGQSGWYLGGRFIGSNRHAAYDNARRDTWPELCQCGRTKREDLSFCSQCYSELPPAMQMSLNADEGEGYEEAYSAASDRLATRRDYGHAYMEAVQCLTQ